MGSRKRTKKNQASCIRLIEEYSFSKVREKIYWEKSVLEEDLNIAIHEFRKYLILIVKGHRRLAMISPKVDEVWHTFILFTEDYASFCEKVFGFFLHHHPALPSQPLDPGSIKRFMKAYEGEFGDLGSIWLPETSCCDGGCGSGCD